MVGGVGGYGSTQPTWDFSSSQTSYYQQIREKANLILSGITDESLGIIGTNAKEITVLAQKIENGQPPPTPQQLSNLNQIVSAANLIITLLLEDHFHKTKPEMTELANAILYYAHAN